MHLMTAGARAVDVSEEQSISGRRATYLVLN
jgi:hypothetical protein